MTWSIVARDGSGGKFAIAIATKFFAVGALCPYVRAGVGAIASQAMVNPLYGRRGLRLLAEGVPAATAIELLVADDDGRDTRQVHLIDRLGRNAAFTGADCVDWAGHQVAADVSVAGNMLVGPDVVGDTLRAYQAGARLPLAERLLDAMDVGQAAGGDKRGRQSAALLAYGNEEYPELDLRVDDHADPLVELRRLYQVAQQRYVFFRRALPTRDNPSGVHDRDELEAMIAAGQAARDGA